MNLTKSFTLDEMTDSATAIRLGIDNTPSEEVIKNLLLLCQKVLQPLRDSLGEPIHVDSGYRSKKLNSKISGSSKTSQHCLGQAADLVCRSGNAQIYEFIKNNLIFDQLIWEFGTDDEPKWVHVSYSEKKNRKECLRSYKINGNTTYSRI